MEKKRESGRKCENIEEALRNTEEKYKMLYETSRDTIMIVNPEKGFLSGNKATLEMFGCADEKEFISMSPGQVSPEYQPDGKLSTVKSQKMMSKALKEGSYFFEWKHKRRDGAEFFATVLLTRADVQGEDVLQATVRDVSTRKQDQAALEKKTALLNQTNKELNQKIKELEKALSHIKRLEGLVPICANCKKMRKDEDNPKDRSSWIPIEKYISDRTEANFTHGLCPDCVTKLYGEMRRKAQRA
ncbi:MAG: PAS domain S-box protein [Candidatus Aadella gelida]|nr:PAS domain S-box protein [Candidatus Aadella gelida]